MLSFRKKIFITYLLVFLVVIALIFPFSYKLINAIVYKTMEDRADGLVVKLQAVPTDEAIVRHLKEKSHVLFFRVSIITSERQVLYDSHAKRLLGPKFSQEYIVEHPEVLAAFKEGRGLNIDYSDLLGEKFFYMAKAFDFHGKTYVIRTAYPYPYVAELIHDARLGFIFLVSMVLFFFSIMTWFIINKLTSPIQQIIAAVKPYQDGLQEDIPIIKLKPSNAQDAFYRLAETLNSLSQRVRSQIATLTHERNEKEAVLESLIEGVVAVNPQLEITYINTIASKMFELEKKDLLGQHFNTTGDDVCYDLLKRSQHDNATVTETIEKKKAGRKVYFNVIAAPKGNKEGAILVLQDQSQHYRIMTMRKDFIANASHELKTPITIIRGFAETLHDNPELPETTLQDITDKIVRNCNRMTTLIKDLLVLSDIENLPTSRLLECDLVHLLQQCKQTLLTVYPDAKVVITTIGDQDVLAMADPSLLEMAFMNLLDNAAKYSEPPAQITITLQREDPWITLTFSDQGFGVPQDKLDKIFQRFYTVDSALSRKMGGSGLGLSIVETIIEKHFGTISVVSEIGKGTTFTVRLPTNIDTLVTQN